MRFPMVPALTLFDGAGPHVSWSSPGSSSSCAVVEEQQCSIASDAQICVRYLLVMRSVPLEVVVGTRNIMLFLSALFDAFATMKSECRAAVWCLVAANSCEQLVPPA